MAQEPSQERHEALPQDQRGVARRLAPVGPGHGEHEAIGSGDRRLAAGLAVPAQGIESALGRAADGSDDAISQLDHQRPHAVSRCDVGEGHLRTGAGDEARADGNGHQSRCGDTVSTGERYVTIDYANGGSINGIIATVETYLKLGNDQTKYVPGHGALASKADIQKYHDLLVRVRDAVQTEIKAGKTEDQAVADKPLAAIGKDLHTNQMADDNMVKMVYRSLKGAKANPA